MYWGTFRKIFREERIGVLGMKDRDLWGTGSEQIPVSSQWNDEDTDAEEIFEPEILPWDYEDFAYLKDTEDASDAKDADRRSEGAMQQKNALREVTEEAKRILDELNGALAKVKPEQADFYQEMRAALAQAAALDTRQSPAEEQLRLAELEEVSYTCMVGKKGLFGILSGAQQRLQDISKESWALAGQAQVDLDIGTLPEEDPRSALDPELPLLQQMRTDDAKNPVQNEGRLQKLVRFDDLQADLSTQKVEHPKRRT